MKHEWKLLDTRNGEICSECGQVMFPYIQGICEMTTYGLSQYGHPEFRIVLEKTQQYDGALLNVLGQMVKEGDTFRAGETCEVPDENGNRSIIRFIDDPDTDNCLRIIFPDRNGRYPEDEKCNKLESLQVCPLSELENPYFSHNHE